MSPVPNVGLNDPIPEKVVEPLVQTTLRISFDVQVTIRDLDMELIRSKFRPDITEDDPEGLEWARQFIRIERHLLHLALVYPEVRSLMLNQTALFELESNPHLDTMGLPLPEDYSPDERHSYEWTDEEIMKVLLKRLPPEQRGVIKAAMDGRDLTQFTDDLFDVQNAEILNISIAEVLEP